MGKKDDKGLEALLEEHEISVSYRSKHLPIFHIQTELPYEDIQELFADYNVSIPKEYKTNDPQ